MIATRCGKAGQGRLLSCSTKTEQAVSMAFKATQCQDFEHARHEVLKKGRSLTEADKKMAIGLNRMATMLCVTSMDSLTKQMRELAS